MKVTMVRTQLGGVREETTELATRALAHGRGRAGRGDRGKGWRGAPTRGRVLAVVPSRCRCGSLTHSEVQDRVTEEVATPDQGDIAPTLASLDVLAQDLIF
ncbi:hypothetical protein HAX54_028182 [Datura stramonium]|uniref:Uncharacterized protein n=1 Tax=Datura stramonium TaxID=4076 RepID=A0ABS8S9G1_DATST|nr:hypothetical protein [Datura stramonium]